MQEQLKQFQGIMNEANEGTKKTFLDLPNRKTATEFIQAVEDMAEKDEDAGGSANNFLSELGYGSEESKEAFKVVENFGGEGHGDQYYLVIKWNEQLWMVPGWYSSDAGGEYTVDDSYEVFPHMTATVEYNKLA